jgi:hypothetical protein
MRFPGLIAPPASRVRCHDGFHATAAVRPQVFATSRRFAPQNTLRACFIPLARPGFSLQGLSLAGSRYGSSPQLLPSCRYRALDSPCEALHAKPGFKALLSRRVRCDRPAVKRSGRPIPSWAFPSPGPASPRPEIVLPRSSPLELASHSYGTCASALLRVLLGRRIGRLSRDHQPSVRFLALSIARAFGRVADRAYRFASGGAPRRRVATLTSWVRHRSLPEPPEQCVLESF